MTYCILFLETGIPPNLVLKFLILKLLQVNICYIVLSFLKIFTDMCCNYSKMSCVMRRPAFCICENKGADQRNCAADQHLCFGYIDSAKPLLTNSEISSLQPFSVALQLGLCWTWLEAPKICFLMTWLKFKRLNSRARL